jgi:antitoxin component YwqK of YwqJK toxin-antitoxin module
MNTSETRKENLINLYNDKGEKHGYWESYYNNGQLWYKGNYVNGQQHGYWESYFDNGQLWYKGNYINGNRHGYWECYRYNGNKFYVGYYDMNKRVDYNPDEPKVIELTLSEIANKLNIDVNQLRIKE